MAINVGDVIDGKYRIVRLLGEGGMGAVYEGENTRIHRRVAIKVLHGNVARNQEAVQRFEREAQAAGRIGSSHIVEVLDLGDLPDGDRYMVMEFLEGQSLSGRIQSRGHLTPADVYPIATQLLQGLAAAHAAGIVHRDLKPDNVYLLSSRQGQADFVKILDFGISKFNALGGGEFSMTRTGSVMGTPYYMSPEQAKGSREIDQRADLYAVGVILYECLAGRVPHTAETFNELIFKIVMEDAPPLASVGVEVDPTFGAIVMRAMARDVTQRFQTAADLEAALHAWKQSDSATVLSLARTALPVAPARTLDPSVPTSSGTGGAWSSTGIGDASPSVPMRSRTPVFAVAGAALALLLVAGVALKMHSSSEAEAVASAQAEKDKEAERIAAEKAAQEAARAKLAEEQKKADEERAKAEQAKAERERKDAEAKAAATSEASSATTATKASAPRKGGRPAPVAAKPAAPAPAAPKPAATTSVRATAAGRAIRTNL